MTIQDISLSPNHKLAHAQLLAAMLYGKQQMKWAERTRDLCAPCFAGEESYEGPLLPTTELEN